METKIVKVVTEENIRGYVKIDKRYKLRIGDNIAILANGGWCAEKLTRENYTFYSISINQIYKIVSAEQKLNLGLPILTNNKEK